MTRQVFLVFVAVILPAALQAQPTDPQLAQTDRALPAVPARQVPARAVGFANGGGRNVNEMPRITPRDVANMEAQARQQAHFDEQQRVARERGNNVRIMEQGRDIPTSEQARDMMRRAERDADLGRRNAEDRSRASAAADAQTTRAVRDSIERSRAAFRGAVNAVNRAAQAGNIARQAWDILHPSDGTCLSNTAPASMPVVPSMCAGSPECASCYQQAYGRINRTRGNFERLRCIYQWNKEYAERAKSFGDNVSSVHGISGLAWQQERRKIERAMDQLGETYDAKYRELLGYVREDLGRVSACEAQFFDNPDWATRYGFMFYSFLEDRYRR